MNVFITILLASLVIFVPAFLYMIMLAGEYDFIVQPIDERMLLSKKYLHPKIRKLVKFTLVCLPIAVLLTIPVAIVYLSTSLIVDIGNVIKKKNQPPVVKKNHLDFSTTNRGEFIINHASNAVQAIDFVEYVMLNRKRGIDVN